MALTNESHQRGLRDFLQLYNTITGFCFEKCVSNFNDRHYTEKEKSCVDVCTDNYVQYNQRFMFNFMDHQERRKRDTEMAAVELAAKEQSEATQAATANEQASSSPDTGNFTTQDASTSQPNPPNQDTASADTLSSDITSLQSHLTSESGTSSSSSDSTEKVL